MKPIQALLEHRILKRKNRKRTQMGFIPVSRKTRSPSGIGVQRLSNNGIIQIFEVPVTIVELTLSFEIFDNDLNESSERQLSLLCGRIQCALQDQLFKIADDIDEGTE